MASVSINQPRNGATGRFERKNGRADYSIIKTEYSKNRERDKNRGVTGGLTMQNYHNQNVINLQMSEKFDGVQGVWDGKVMQTRTGNVIHAPGWWIATLPNIPLAGELWLGRGRLDETSAIMRSKKNNDSKWRQVRYMVFESPQTLKDIGPYAMEVEQITITKMSQFKDFYARILSAGGEGVVIKYPDGSTLKHKPVKDSDGILTGFKTGTGCNLGLIGSFILRLKNGRELKLGGLNGDLRMDPPSLGSIIKFRFQGLTSSGLPRHAMFAGIRAEQSLP